MLNAINFNDQVAIVTGAGRGLGKAYAVLLASRGASVVVNDIGSVEGADVVDEISVSGGIAVSTTHDVATQQGGEELVRLAIERFGRLDILIHNAGFTDAAPFASTPPEMVERQERISLLQAYYVGQPAWRQMLIQEYGRIVLTSSGSIFGAEDLGAYAAAKSSILGLAQTLHVEARRSAADLLINVVIPSAETRLTRAGVYPERLAPLADPANVAAAVGFLASRDCSVNGQWFRVGGTYVGRTFLGVTGGWASGHTPITPEEVSDHIDEICDLGEFAVPADMTELMDVMQRRIEAALDA